MMQLKRHINPDFPVIHPYSGINSITDELITNGYLAVIDENNKFWGILTPGDLVKRQKKKEKKYKLCLSNDLSLGIGRSRSLAKSKDKNTT